MAATNDTCIGRLTEVQESRMMAMLTHDQGFPRIDIEGRQVAVGQIGSYLIVRQGSIQVVTMVMRAREEERALRVSLGEQGNGTVRRSVNRGLLELVPLGELDRDHNFQRGVVNYPVPGAEVHTVVEAEVDALFKAHRGRKYELGYLPSLPSVKLCLDPAPLFGRHLAILGQSGSGKSWSVTSLLQRTQIIDRHMDDCCSARCRPCRMPISSCLICTASTSGPIWTDAASRRSRNNTTDTSMPVTWRFPTGC